MESLKDWHDFFVVLGAASGSLIGAMFVVVSIATGILTPERTVASRLFLTPTIIHLSVVLLASAFVLVPTLSVATFGASFGIAGIGGSGYAGWNVFKIRGRREVDRVDHLWYGFAPVLAYLLMIGGAALEFAARPGAVETLALSLALLVVASIRNAWDLIVYFVQQHSTG